MSVRAKLLVVMSAAAVVGATAPTVAAADVKAGRALAEMWCSSCHVVGQESQTAATDGAPTFASIADRSGTSEAGLRTFLAEPHNSAMKGIILPRLEIADLAAYIASLREP